MNVEGESSCEAILGRISANSLVLSDMAVSLRLFQQGRLAVTSPDETYKGNVEAHSLLVDNLACDIHLLASHPMFRVPSRVGLDAIPVFAEAVAVSPACGTSYRLLEVTNELKPLADKSGNAKSKACISMLAVALHKIFDKDCLASAGCWKKLGSWVATQKMKISVWRDPKAKALLREFYSNYKKQRKMGMMEPHG